MEVHKLQQLKDLQSAQTELGKRTLRAIIMSKANKDLGQPWVPCMGLGSRLGLAFLGFRNCFSIFLVIKINYVYFISLIICLLFILS